MNERKNAKYYFDSSISKDINVIDNFCNPVFFDEETLYENLKVAQSEKIMMLINTSGLRIEDDLELFKKAVNDLETIIANRK